MGGIVTVPVYLLWVTYRLIPDMIKPSFKPEKVLPPTFFVSISLPICLFWYGCSAQKSVHWIVPIIGSSFFTVGIVTLFNSILNYLAIGYPAYVASIFAGNALFRAPCGAIFPLFVCFIQQLYINRHGNSFATWELDQGIRCWVVSPSALYRFPTSFIRYLLI
jgi:DHA1 family multidrug resistance protein-like MFS transporter